MEATPVITPREQARFSYARREFQLERKCSWSGDAGEKQTVFKMRTNNSLVVPCIRGVEQQRGGVPASSMQVREFLSRIFSMQWRAAGLLPTTCDGILDGQFFRNAQLSGQRGERWQAFGMLTWELIRMKLSQIEHRNGC